ncbi:hypothetical protein B8W90_11045 [Staphylococcus hominis]|nr:hypothetical protein B8W90_11045 [Staphylococcus hominis]
MFGGAVEAGRVKKAHGEFGEILAGSVTAIGEPRATWAVDCPSLVTQSKVNFNASIVQGNLRSCFVGGRHRDPGFGSSGIGDA